MAMEEQFHDEMVWLGEEAARQVYNPQRFKDMVRDRGGLATAQYLLDEPNISDGFATLWEAGRLDLTVEAVVIQERWMPLFTENQLQVARQRLEDAGYKT